MVLVPVSDIVGSITLADNEKRLSIDGSGEPLQLVLRGNKLTQTPGLDRYRPY
jgi:hypothetical protein